MLTISDGPHFSIVWEAETCNLANISEMACSQFKVDNALLRAEIALLERRLAYYQLVAKRMACVDAVLLKVDAQQTLAQGEISG